jgi:hypothetical protein
LRANVDAAGDTLAKLYIIAQNQANQIAVLEGIISDSTPDGDSLVNRISELLSVFSTFPEGVNALDLFNSKLDKVSAFTVVTDGSTLALNLASKEMPALSVAVAASPRTLAITNKPTYGNGILKLIKNIAGTLTVNLDTAYTNKDRVTGDDITSIALAGTNGAHFLLSFIIDGNTIYWFYAQAGGTSITFATNGEAITGTATDKAMNPATTVAYVDSISIEGPRPDLLPLLEAESGWSNSRKTITGQADNGQAGQEAYHSSALYTYKCLGSGVWSRTPSADRIAGKITDSTIITNITTGGNWSAAAYTGPAIAVFEGQYYRSATHWFQSYADNTINRWVLA